MVEPIMVTDNYMNRNDGLHMVINEIDKLEEIIYKEVKAHHIGNER